MTANPAKTFYEKFYVHDIAEVNLSKIYFLANVKKICKTVQKKHKTWRIG